MGRHKFEAHSSVRRDWRRNTRLALQRYFATTKLPCIMPTRLGSIQIDREQIPVLPGEVG